MSSSQHAVRCAVIGQPIAHSKSPMLHQAFAAQCQLTLDYQRQELTQEHLPVWIRRFFAEGGCGLNVTLPYKSDVLSIADMISDRAKLAGAANTLGRDGEGRIWADNTDGIGLVRDLQRLGVVLDGRLVLLLGAGGAARGIVPALLDAGVAGIRLYNRSTERAEALVQAMADPRAKVGGKPDSTQCLLISTVSDGLSALLAGISAKHVQIAYDLNYGERAEVFRRAMLEYGIDRVYTGWGMLVEQAAESFRLWHGVTPDTAALHKLSMD